MFAFGVFVGSAMVVTIAVAFSEAIVVKGMSWSLPLSFSFDSDETELAEPLLLSLMSLSVFHVLLPTKGKTEERKNST